MLNASINGRMSECTRRCTHRHSSIFYSSIYSYASMTHSCEWWSVSNLCSFFSLLQINPGLDTAYSQLDAAHKIGVSGVVDEFNAGTHGVQPYSDSAIHPHIRIILVQHTHIAELYGVLLLVAVGCIQTRSNDDNQWWWWCEKEHVCRTPSGKSIVFVGAILTISSMNK